MYSINNLEDSNRGLSSCCMYTKKGRETAINASLVAMVAAAPDFILPKYNYRHTL